MKALIISIVLLIPSLAMADRPSQWFAKACGLLGTPTSVTIDVYLDSSPGSVLATVLNADIDQVGTTDCFVADLNATAAAIAFPAIDARADKSYTLVWTDDAASNIVTDETIVGLPGAHSQDLSCEKETVVYSAVAIPSRGLTAAMIAQGRPSYYRVDVSCSHNFGAPDGVKYKIMNYDSFGRVDFREPSDTPPSP